MRRGFDFEAQIDKVVEYGENYEQINWFNWSKI